MLGRAVASFLRLFSACSVRFRACAVRFLPVSSAFVPYKCGDVRDLRLFFPLACLKWCGVAVCGDAETFALFSACVPKMGGVAVCGDAETFALFSACVP